MTSSNPGAPGAPTLPGYVPVPRASLGPAVNAQGYFVGRVERNLYWVTDGDYHSAWAWIHRLLSHTAPGQSFRPGE